MQRSVVSAADKLHNARSILQDLRTEGESVWLRFKGGEEGTLWYYPALVDAFRAAGDLDAIVGEMNDVDGEIERFEPAQDSDL